MYSREFILPFYRCDYGTRAPRVDGSGFLKREIALRGFVFSVRVHHQVG